MEVRCFMRKSDLYSGYSAGCSETHFLFFLGIEKLPSKALLNENGECLGYSEILLTENTHLCTQMITMLF